MIVLFKRSVEALLDELKDLRIEAIARKRLQNFDKSRAISHEDMLKEFELHNQSAKKRA